ncbi:MAG: hypothetical protein HXS48_14730 [Theionarchaea archaeon]|nr:hypothetical protein [Theionarchaea archaeon]
MKRIMIFLVIAATLPVYIISSASVVQEFQVVINVGDQLDPGISGYVAVWDDRRNGNSDIYCYDFSTSVEFCITTDKNDQQDSEIFENIIVWQDYRNGNWDIYSYDICTKTLYCQKPSKSPKNRFNTFPSSRSSIERSDFCDMKLSSSSKLYFDSKTRMKGIPLKLCFL